jgi:hypothetical protein
MACCSNQSACLWRSAAWALNARTACSSEIPRAMRRALSACRRRFTASTMESIIAHKWAGPLFNMAQWPFVASRRPVRGLGEAARAVQATPGQGGKGTEPERASGLPTARRRGECGASSRSDGESRSCELRGWTPTYPSACSPSAAGRRAMPPRTWISMMIMRPPQHGHDSSLFFPLGRGSGRFGSCRISASSFFAVRENLRGSDLALETPHDRPNAAQRASYQRGVV